MNEPDRETERHADEAAVRLDELAVGRCGHVVGIQCEPDAANRLAGMGVCIGRMVQLVQRGDPMILRAFGSRIGLSYRLGRCVQVRPCRESECASHRCDEDPV